MIIFFKNWQHYELSILYNILLKKLYVKILPDKISSPLHKVPEQVDDLLFQGGPVLDDGVSLVGHLLLKLLQLLDLLPDLQLGLGQGRYPGCKTRS